jgi:hypothetical protein
VRRGERKVDVARLLDGLAAVQRLRDRELACAFLKDSRDSEEDLRPLGGAPAAPGRERLLRGPHGERDVLRARLRDLGERLLGGG